MRETNFHTRGTRLDGMNTVKVSMRGKAGIGSGLFIIGRVWA
jgi:hypothetical protein